jgi:hypothetical protein
MGLNDGRADACRSINAGLTTGRHTPHSTHQHLWRRWADYWLNMKRLLVGIHLRSSILLVIRWFVGEQS